MIATQIIIDSAMEEFLKYGSITGECILPYSLLIKLGSEDTDSLLMATCDSSMKKVVERRLYAFLPTGYTNRYLNFETLTLIRTEAINKESMIIHEKIGEKGVVYSDIKLTTLEKKYILT